MKVTERRGKSPVEYRTLSKGETFKLNKENCDHFNHVFMVTDGKLSSVNLNTGQEYEFGEGLMVRVVDCELIVSD